MSIIFYKELLSFQPVKYTPKKEFNLRIDNTFKKIDLVGIDNVVMYDKNAVDVVKTGGGDVKNKHDIRVSVGHIVFI